jgi:Capsular polysaccharide synthesis, CpsB/CapC
MAWHQSCATHPPGMRTDRFEAATAGDFRRRRLVRRAARPDPDPDDDVRQHRSKFAVAVTQIPRNSTGTDISLMGRRRAERFGERRPLPGVYGSLAIAGALVALMYDLHCHILPGLDDGAADLSVSLEMARAFVADGVSVVACTPHILPWPAPIKWSGSNVS